MRLTDMFRVHYEYRSGKFTFDIFTVTQSTFIFVDATISLTTVCCVPCVTPEYHVRKISDSLESSSEFVRRPRPGEMLRPIYHRVPIGIFYDQYHLKHKLKAET